MEINEHRIGSISFVDLAAADPGEQGRFYTEVMGWDQIALPGGAYTMFTSGGRPVAGMLPLAAGSDVTSQWSTYVTVADADGICAETERLGGTVLQAPFDLPGAGRVAMIADPSGAAICVFEGWADGGFKLFDEPGAACWFEETTADARGALEFYEQLFGWRGTKMDDLPIDYWLCALDPTDPDPAHDRDRDTDGDIGGDIDGDNDNGEDDEEELEDDESGAPAFAGIMQYPAQMADTAAAWQVSFSIHTDIATFIDHATTLGAQVAAGPTETEFGSGAIMLDPAGARFAAFDRSTSEHQLR